MTKEVTMEQAAIKVGDRVRLTRLWPGATGVALGGDDDTVTVRLDSPVRIMETSRTLIWPPMGALERIEPAITAEQVEVESVVPLEYLNLERRHNAKCTRCGGPAFEGLGLPKCEAPGGCVPWYEREPVADSEVFRGVADARANPKDPTKAIPTEYGWYVSDHRGQTGPYATRELAVAAWREAVRS